MKLLFTLSGTTHNIFSMNTEEELTLVITKDQFLNEHNADFGKLRYDPFKGWFDIYVSVDIDDNVDDPIALCDEWLNNNEYFSVSVPDAKLECNKVSNFKSLQAINDFWKTPKGKIVMDRDLADYFNSKEMPILRVVDQIKAKWNKLSTKDKKSLVERINHKYASKSYIDRYYNRCREPEEGLWWWAYEYAKRYGKVYTKGDNIEFCSFCRIVDDMFVVSRFDGQGSFVIVNAVEKP